jgi:hypothetical protein
MAARDDSFDIRIFELMPNCLKMAIIVNSSWPAQTLFISMAHSVIMKRLLCLRVRM